VTDAVFELDGVGVDQLAVEHTLDVDEATGGAVVTVPIRVTSGRSGFGPSLSLSYSSGAGNSPLGLGWSLAHAATVTVDTRSGHPRYDGTDAYAFAGDELVPETTAGAAGARDPRRFTVGDFDVGVFRRRTAGWAMRFERWRHRETGRVHWRSRDGEDVLTVYGLRDAAAGRIADPDDERRTFAWLPEAVYDGRGNAMVFDYMPETASGVDRGSATEAARIESGSFSQRYLKAVRYGNTHPLSADGAVPAANTFLFEVIVDYGDHAAEPAPAPDRPPPVRLDPFSSFTAGWEVRTWRLARRILLFHRFAELGAGATLVQETRLSHDEDAAGSVLRSVTHVGVRRAVGTLTRRSRPPLTFRYADPQIGRAFVPAPVEATENVPQGVTGVRYRFVDLLGEGLPGILTDDGRGWYFKRNEGAGRFGPQAAVSERPAARLGRFALADFDRDGNTNLVVMHGRDAGWYELDRDTGRWDGYRPFPATPQVSGPAARVELLDVTGDGLPDIVVEGPDRFTWFPSKGKDGYDAGRDIPKPAASPGATLPRMGEAPELDLKFADMNGDGLPDLVRVRNGRVEYWPQIGHGRFGAPVLMEDSPVIHDDHEFDISRLHLVDLDGSGTADLVYLGRGEISIWTNASGNRLVAREPIRGLPYIEEVSSARVTDFLGGTPCLVWSSPLAGGAAPMQYLPLAGPNRPGLLLSASNGIGLETTLAYGSSADHYLADRRAGRDWASRIPGHPLVVNRREVADAISGTRVVTRFAYHDARYDPDGRRFGGFGQVDRLEVDDRPQVVGDPDFVRSPGSCTRTFFHPGAPPQPGRPRGAWSGDDEEPLLAPQRIELPETLSTGEYLDALRALRGRPVREEVFALDAEGRLEDHPLSVTQTRWGIRRLEAARRRRRAAFATYLADRLMAGYEGHPTDPRVNHHLALAVDAYGAETLGASVSYPRRPGAAEALPAQGRCLAEATRERLLSIDDEGRHEVAIPVESEEFELALPGVSAASAPLDAQALTSQVTAALAAPLQHHEPLAGPGVRARRLEWERSRFWNAARTAPLALGQAAPPTLIHHEETACFTTEFADEIYGGAVDAAGLAARGYVAADGVWWQSGPVQRFAGPAAFYTETGVEEGDGTRTAVRQDPYSLTAVEITDAAGNAWRAEVDYHVVGPGRVTDPNGNVSEVRRDPLGVVVVASRSGHVAAADGSEVPYGDEPLSAYVSRPELDVASALADPRRYLQSASSYLAYDLDGGGPVRIVAITRERSVHDLLGGDPGAEAPALQVGYLDGFGASLQTKQLADPGPAISRDAGGALVLDAAGNPVVADAPRRWLVSGHVVFDGYRRLVRRYEPFYGATPEFEPEAELASFGVSATLHYDALGRLVREELPNGTLNRVERDAWAERRFDPVDTVAGTAYEALRAPLPDADPEKQALRKALANADTPVSVHTDARGAEVRIVERGTGGEERVTQIEPDALGRPVVVRDARGVVASRERHDMAGRRLLQETADGGRRRVLFDAKDNPVEGWDARDVRERWSYDALGRLTAVEVQSPGGAPRLVEQLVYGDAPGTPRARRRNARGQVVTHRDEAGQVSYERFDPEGRPLEWQRRFKRDVALATDWRAAVPLETAGHRGEVLFDARTRVIRERLADGAERSITYARAGGARRIAVRLPGAAADVVILRDAEYNARGQRLRADLGTAVELTTEFDPETHATSRVRARRTGAGARTLADLEYTYDPLGNVVRVLDGVQQPAAPTPLVQGLTVSSEQGFTYDAYNQLVEATGRVHQALTADSYRPGSAGTIKGTRHLTLNNGAAVERYRRTYRYDLAANLLETAHHGATANWVTGLSVAAGSNRALPTAEAGANPAASIAAAHDAAGNLEKLAHLRRMQWGDRDRLQRAVVIDRSGTGRPDDDERYEYGADGLRTRKVTRRLVGNTVETTEKRYLDGCEIKRIRRGSTLVLERLTAIVGDGADRLAVIHRWTVDQGQLETDAAPSSSTHLQLNNLVGSSRLEVDPQGRVIAYEEYFPFGGSAFIAGDRVKEVLRRDYRYRSRESDDATGLVDFGHRLYQPWIGRWLSPDPSGPTDGQNLYRFVRNNPVSLIDPDGLQSQPRRGQVLDRTVASPPPAVLEAWGRLTDAQQREWLSRGVYWRVDEAGRGVLMTAEEARQHQERVVSSGRDFTRLHVDPRAGRGTGAGAGGGKPDRTRGQRQTGQQGNQRTRGSHGGGSQGAGTRPRGAHQNRTGTGAGAGHRGNGATNAQGAGAGNRGRSTGSGGSNAGDVHAADGGSGTATKDPAGGKGGGGEGNDPGAGGQEGTGPGGTGTEGTGPGSGAQGTGPGGGGTAETPGTGPGEGAGDQPGTGTGTDKTPGEGGEGVDGTGDGRQGPGPEGVGQDKRVGVGAGNGPGGEPGGVAGGRPGGSPNGIAGGAETGAPAGPGAQPGGTDPNGSPQNPGEQRGNGTGQDPAGERPDERRRREPGTQGGDGSPSGERRPGGQQPTTLDRLSRWAGYLNFEFKDPPPGGQSGGTPGGMGSFNLGPIGQIVYIAVTVISTISLVKSIVQGVIKLGSIGVRALLRRAFTGLKALIPAARTAIARTFSAAGRLLRQTAASAGAGGTPLAAITRAAIIKELRRIGTREAQATVALIKRGIVDLKLLTSTPLDERLGQYVFKTNRIELFVNRIKDVRQAAGLAAHETKHFLQRVTQTVYHRGHEFEAYVWQSRVDKRVLSVASEIWDFIRNSKIYRTVREPPPGWVPKL
jgi:RHS repeat-associated protein